jgi:hypothetical protein
LIYLCVLLPIFSSQIVHACQACVDFIYFSEVEGDVRIVDAIGVNAGGLMDEPDPTVTVNKTVETGSRHHVFCGGTLIIGPDSSVKIESEGLQKVLKSGNYSISYLYETSVLKIAVIRTFKNPFVPLVGLCLSFVTLVIVLLLRILKRIGERKTCIWPRSVRTYILIVSIWFGSIYILYLLLNVVIAKAFD